MTEKNEKIGRIQLRLDGREADLVGYSRLSGFFVRWDDEPDVTRNLNADFVNYMTFMELDPEDPEVDLIRRRFVWPTLAKSLGRIQLGGRFADLVGYDLRSGLLVRWEGEQDVSAVEHDFASGDDFTWVVDFTGCSSEEAFKIKEQFLRDAAVKSRDVVEVMHDQIDASIKSQESNTAPSTSVQRIRQLDADREHLKRRIAELEFALTKANQSNTVLLAQLNVAIAERDRAQVDQEELNLARAQIQIVREIAKGMTKGDAEQ